MLNSLSLVSFIPNFYIFAKSGITIHGFQHIIRSTDNALQNSRTSYFGNYILINYRNCQLYKFKLW